MKKILGFRTKLEILTVVGIILLVGMSSIWATDWVISSTNDNKSTFILCSNGNYYTDLTQANLQAAVFSLNGSGGEVVLPVCNLSITSTIYLVENVTLRGMGKNNSFISLTAGSNCDMVNIISRSNIKILDICFNMYNYSQDELANISLIDITGAAGDYSNNITIRDCKFLNGCVKSMIDCQEYTNYITIENCVFDKRTWYNGSNWGFGAAIWISEGDYVIRNNLIRDTWACGIVMEHSTTVPQIQSKHAIIDGNIITGVTAIGVTMEGATAASQYISKSGFATISNNIFYDMDGSTAYDTDGVCCGVQANYNSTVVGNIFKNCGKGISIGVSVNDTSITITGNTFSNLESYAITSSEDGVIVSGNTFNDCDGTAVISSTKNMVVSNNIFRDAATSGIYFKLYSSEATQKSGVIITGNQIYGTGSYGIYVDEQSTESNYVIISNNYVSSVANDGIHIEDTCNATISGNIVVDASVANQGIDVGDSSNNTIIGNRVIGFLDGIDEAGTSNYNIIVGNNCLGCTNPIDINGANTVNSTNLGTIS